MAKTKPTKFNLTSRMNHALTILDRAEAKGDSKKVMEQRMRIKNIRAMMDDDFDYGKFNKGGVKKMNMGGVMKSRGGTFKGTF